MTLASRRSAAVLAATGLAVVLALVPARAEPDLRAWSDAAGDAEPFRSRLQAQIAAGDGLNTAALDALVGFAATACSAAGSDGLAPDDAALARTVAGRVAVAGGPATPAAIEAMIATGHCLERAGDAVEASVLTRQALERALSMPPGAARDATIARVAEVAGFGAALPPYEIGVLANRVGSLDQQAAVMRGWAVGVLLWQGIDSGLDIAAVGPYRPLGLDPAAAVAAVDAALADGRIFNALLYAAALDPDGPADRAPVLRTVFDAAVAAGDPALARLAARAASGPDHDAMLADLAGWALQAGLPADAEYATRLMQPSATTVALWLEIAGAYRDLAYPLPQQAAFDTARAIAEGLPPADRGPALMQVAARAAALGAVADAIALLQTVPGADGRHDALAALAVRLAEEGRPEEALRWARELRGPAVAPALHSRALGAIVRSLAQSGDLTAAVALLRQDPELAGGEADRTLQTVAGALVAAGLFAEADDLAGRIGDAAMRDQIALQIAIAAGDAALGDRVNRHVDRMLAEPDPERRRTVLTMLADTLEAAGRHDLLAGLHDRIARVAPDQDVDPLLLPLAVGAARAGDFAAALETVQRLADPLAADRGRAAVARALAEAGRLEEAVGLVRAMSDELARVSAFRLVAEIQALGQDVHGVVPEVYAARPADFVPPGVAAGSPQSAARLAAPVAEQAGIAVYRLEGEPDTLWPELSGLRDRAAAAAAVPADVRALVTTGSPAIGVHRQPMTANPYNEKFIEIVPILDYAQRQGEPTPHLIALSAGTVTLSQVREAMLLMGRGADLEVAHGIYRLRRPLVVGPDAALVITGADAPELRLSTDDYAYLVSGGTLVIADTTITSWDAATQAPSELELGEGEFLFRPFITAWSGTHTYATRSVFRALGYNNRKSWGLTTSSGPQDFTYDGQSAMPSPEVLLVENLFERLYYGYYSYHTDDADIIGNEYRDNLIYGPDPHDYSSSILMALNTAYGTVKKHGLIVSREVSGLFVGNVAFDNHGAGIMLDRLSNHSVIYANAAFDNENDGITVYETACVIVANNWAEGNALSGIRVRNSVDVAVLSNTIVDNAGEAVVVYTDPLETHTWRNLELDPFWTIATAAIADNRVTGNGGAFRFENVLAATLNRNTIMGNGDRWFAGDFQPVVNMLVRTFQLDQSSVLLADMCQPEAQRYADCRFRDFGLFAFDGQDDWQFADPPAQCTGSFVVSSDGLMQEPRL